MKKIVCQILIYLFVFSHLPLCAESTAQLLKEAEESYFSGEQAKKIAQREEGFNKALKIYSGLEASYNPIFGDGKLYYDIGNTYFQLGNYPMAILYYNRALRANPRDNKFQNNLQIAMTELGIPNYDVTVFQKVFPFHYKLGLPERLRLFFIFGLILLLSILGYIWRPNKWLKRGMMLFAILTAVLSLSVGYTKYLEPISGVLIKSTVLYRDAGEQFATVSDQPTIAGNKVEVLEVRKDGQWLKILTSTGAIGYVPASTIRLI